MFGTTAISQKRPPATSGGDALPLRVTLRVTLRVIRDQLASAAGIS
jgi:hypothetical protein